MTKNDQIWPKITKKQLYMTKNDKKGPEMTKSQKITQKLPKLPTNDKMKKKWTNDHKDPKMTKKDQNMTKKQPNMTKND